MDASRYLTADETVRLRDHTELLAHRDERAGRMTWPRRWIVVDLALSTGLRVSELAALTWADWSPSRGTLRVRRLKRRQSRRESLPVPDGLTAHLRHWWALCGSQGSGGPIVPGRYGGALSRPAWRRAWQAACRAAGVPVLPIHGARHTAAHRIIETHGLAVAQHTLGHSTPTITSNMYGHVSADQVRSALAEV